MKERKKLTSLFMWIFLLIPLVIACHPISELSGGSSVDIQIDKGCDSKYGIGEHMIISFKVTSQVPTAIVAVIRYTPDRGVEYLIRNEIFFTNQVHSYQELVTGPEGEYCLVIIATAETGLIAECRYNVIDFTPEIESEEALSPPITPEPFPQYPSPGSESPPSLLKYLENLRINLALLGLLVSIAVLVVLFIMYRGSEPEYPVEDVHLDEDKDVRKW